MSMSDHEWSAFYDHFDYFSPDAVRDGCHPRIMERPDAREAIVLVHGLTDSPYFLTAIQSDAGSPRSSTGFASPSAFRA